jgi:hypothetical protein
LLAKRVTRLPLLHAAVILLSALTIYDWLSVTARFSRGACLLLAIGMAVALGRWFARSCHSGEAQVTRCSHGWRDGWLEFGAAIGCRNQGPSQNCLPQ